MSWFGDLVNAAFKGNTVRNGKILNTPSPSQSTNTKVPFIPRPFDITETQKKLSTLELYAHKANERHDEGEQFLHYDMVPAALKYKNEVDDIEKLKAELQQLKTEVDEAQFQAEIHPEDPAVEEMYEAAYRRNYVRMQEIKDIETQKIAVDLDSYLTDNTSKKEAAEWWWSKNQPMYIDWRDRTKETGSPESVTWQAFREELERRAGSISSYGSDNAFNAIYDAIYNLGRDPHQYLDEILKAEVTGGHEWDVEVPYADFFGW